MMNLRYTIQAFPPESHLRLLHHSDMCSSWPAIAHDAVSEGGQLGTPANQVVCACPRTGAHVRQQQLREPEVDVARGVRCVHIRDALVRDGRDAVHGQLLPHRLGLLRGSGAGAGSQRRSENGREDDCVPHGRVSRSALQCTSPAPPPAVLSYLSRERPPL